MRNKKKNTVKKTTDVLIIGSGIAGLTLAIKTAHARPELNIILITKVNQGESNTRYAQGGVAAVWNHEKDSYQKHIEDTLDAGDGLCDEEIVRIVVEEGPTRVQEIIDWGTRFDKDEHDYNLGMEGGHSEYRILHYKDLTGFEIQRALMEKAKNSKNITVLEHFHALDLLTQHHRGYNITRVTPNIECYGAYALNKENGDIITFLAKVTIVASGGAGQIYRNTTNPIIATGDGVAMAYRANARIESMEFVQFHPTALYNPAGENPVFLVSEAVRGYGAILRDFNGNEFMHHYDDRKSLAPRDIVARAIDNEMKKSGAEHLYLDCTHLDKKGFYDHFPTIYDKCMSLGIDPMKDYIPVVPACHYSCGGIKTDEQGKTSIQYLYACGECTYTGLHGANRLASNSLLEAMVFAHRIHLDIIQNIDHIQITKDLPDWNKMGTNEPKEMVLITQSLKEVKEIMSFYVGIVRSNVRLKRAFDRLGLLYEETERLYRSSPISPQLCELRNLITISYLVTRSAAMRRESRGLHYTTDYPNQLDFIDQTIL